MLEHVQTRILLDEFSYSDISGSLNNTPTFFVRRSINPLIWGEVTEPSERELKQLVLDNFFTKLDAGISNTKELTAFHENGVCYIFKTVGRIFVMVIKHKEGVLHIMTPSLTILKNHAASRIPKRLLKQLK